MNFSLCLLGRVSINQSSGCWEWLYSTTRNGGYGAVKYKGRNWVAHRLSYFLGRGFIPPGLFVRHKCDNRICINPTHLCLGTHSSNMQDAIDRKRFRHKLSREDVETIRRSSKSYRELASEYGVHRHTIWWAKHRRVS